MYYSRNFRKANKGFTALQSAKKKKEKIVYPIKTKKRRL
jgi:hypothetical protein